MSDLPQDWDDEDVRYWDLISEEITFVAKLLKITREAASQLVVLNYQTNAMNALTEVLMSTIEVEEIEPWKRTTEEEDADDTGGSGFIH